MRAGQPLFTLYSPDLYQAEAEYLLAYQGAAGSFLAGFVGRSLGWYHGGADTPGVVASVLGAMLILSIFRFMVGRGGSSSTEV